MPAKGKADLKQTGGTRSKRTSSGRGGGTKTKKRQAVRDLMTTDPVALLATETIAKAAEVMRDDDIGDVIVLDDTTGRICGIVTDRDIVIRAVADGADPGRTTLSSVCSSDLVTVGPNDPVDEVIELMRSKAVRRVPVVEDDRPVGVIALGDLAVARDPDSVLGKISAASPDDA